MIFIIIVLGIVVIYYAITEVDNTARMNFLKQKIKKQEIEIQRLNNLDSR